jgi:hypothetical protein
MNDRELIELILPEGILDYFDYTKVEKEEVSYPIHLSEKNIFLYL